jgi:hypothetical protein
MARYFLGHRAAGPVAAIGVALSLACGGGAAPAPDGPAPAPTCRNGVHICDGETLMACRGGSFRLVEDCALSGEFCTVDDENGPATGGGCLPMHVACPFVDVLTADGWLTVGEILRNLNHPSLTTSQSLALPASAVRDEVLVVQLAERKPEVTHLDRIWVEVGGRVVLPSSCRDGGAACRIDGQTDTLREGDLRRYVFEGIDGPPTLWAHGHYVPVAPR